MLEVGPGASCARAFLRAAAVGFVGISALLYLTFTTQVDPRVVPNGAADFAALFERAWLRGLRRAEVAGDETGSPGSRLRKGFRSDPL